MGKKLYMSISYLKQSLDTLFPILYSNVKNNLLTRTRKKFTPEEDARLRFLVDRQGPKKWDLIAREMPGRTSRQCRDRYKNYLVPGFFNGQWSEEEDELLLSMYLKHGSQWSKLSKFFKNRSANSLKNRWNYFVSKRLDKDDSKVDLNVDSSDEVQEENLKKNECTKTKILHELSTNISIVPTLENEKKHYELSKNENNNIQQKSKQENNINVVDFQFDPQLFVDTIKMNDNIFIQNYDPNFSNLLDFDLCF